VTERAWGRVMWALFVILLGAWLAAMALGPAG
jgi:hypothetical protein